LIFAFIRNRLVGSYLVLHLHQPRVVLAVVLLDRRGGGVGQQVVDVEAVGEALEFAPVVAGRLDVLGAVLAETPAVDQQHVGEDVALRERGIARGHARDGAAARLEKEHGGAAGIRAEAVDDGGHQCRAEPMMNPPLRYSASLRGSSMSPERCSAW
jgi:hypothetical protein